MSATKTIAYLAMPGVQLLDVAGPMDVFAEANAQAGREVYRQIIVATRGGTVRSSAGARLVADYHIKGASGGGGTVERMETPIDTLLVAGDPNALDMAQEPAVTAWLREVARNAKRYGSICSGAFALAKAGLLDGRRVATHWALVKRLALEFPKVRVDADAIHLRDGRVRTAAGVTSGLDLALALVEEDLGREIAVKVAAQLVMLFKRPGGQKQFSRGGQAAPEGRSALQEVQRWALAHPAEARNIDRLARRMHLSTRHFARLFQKETGVTPGDWALQVRVEAARKLLEAGRAGPKQAAFRCGFGSVNTLRRAFVRLLGVTPAEYQKRYGGAGRGGAI